MPFAEMKTKQGTYFDTRQGLIEASLTQQTFTVNVKGSLHFLLFNVTCKDISVEKPACKEMPTDASIRLLFFKLYVN